MSADVKIGFFGAHRIEAQGVDARLKTKRAWALLAYLAANRHRAVPRDELAALLWERSSQDQARASLRQELSNLRAGVKQLGWTPVEADKSTVRLAVEDAEIDLVRLDQAVLEGDAALAGRLYEGPFLADLALPSEPFEAWRRGEQARLAESVIGVQLSALGPEGDGASDPATEGFAQAARTILTIDPSNERAHRDMMRHFCANDRPAEALRQFKRCETALREELDVTPSSATLALRDEIRRPTSAVPARAANDQVANGAVQTGSANPLGSPTVADESSSKRSRVGRYALAALATLGVLAGGTTAVAGIQYVSAGQRLTRHNVVCTLPFLHRRGEDVVRIGAILPYAVEHGERLRWAVQRFQRDRRNDYPFAFRISYEDSSPGVEVLPAIFESFERENVKAVLGPLESRKAWEAKKWGNANRVPVVSPLASAAYLARTEGTDYFFRTGMSDGVRARALTNWLKLKGLADNPYIIHEMFGGSPAPGDPEIYGQAQATAVKSHLERFEEYTFVRNDEESQRRAADAVTDETRAVIAHGYTSNLVNVIRRLQDEGKRNPIFLMGVVMQRLQNADFPFPEQLHVVTGINSEARNLASSAKLRADFEAESPASLDYDISAYYAYDAMSMILDAVTAARAESCGGYASPTAVAEALRRTPAKRRKVLHAGFLPDTQEIYFESDGLRMLDGKRFVPVGIGG